MALDASRVRPPALAGSFYPADPGALARLVDDSLDKAERFAGAPKAIIAPHAGYIYSGEIAATAYGAIRARRETIRRVVLLGPCHRVAVRAFAVPGHAAFATPLGAVPLDHEAIDRLLREMPEVEQRDDAHLPEHCLETQLPFLQRLLGDFAIVPIIVGAAPAERVERALELLWGGEETLIVVSSDLSHFYDYDEARRLDGAACQAIEMLAPDRLGDEQACGRHSIYGLLRRAQALDLRATTLDLRNSGDTAGRTRRDSVVGYSAVAFEDAAQARLSEAQRRQLLEVASQTIANGLRRGKQPEVAVETYPWPLRAMRACFVTLKIGGDLRGCVGSVRAHQPLVADVCHSAYRAAFGDRRFDALAPEELSEDGMALSISILSQPRALDFASEAEAVAQLRPGIDGVILRDGERNGLLLPQVWDAIGEPDVFLRALKQKAGLAEDHWSERLSLQCFGTESFGTRVQPRAA